MGKKFGVNYENTKAIDVDRDDTVDYVGNGIWPDDQRLHDTI